MREGDPLFTTEDLTQATGAELVSPASPVRGMRVDNVVIDSRKVCPGSLFVALPGARTDGHLFVAEAALSGATAVMVARGSLEQVRAAGLPAGVAVLSVADTLRGLQDLAIHHRSRFPALVRVGVTGSSGKTTTKEIIGGILARVADTAVSEGNLNSETGLPLAVLALRPHHRFGVFELGIDHIGEMERLAEILLPDAALITNIGSAHSLQIGDRRAIAAEKKKIFSFFRGRETGFLWEDEPFYGLLADGARGRIVPFGPRSTEGYKGSTDLGLDGHAMNWEELQVHFPLFGRHNLLNALAAITLTTHLGAGAAAVKDGLEAVRPLGGRSEVIRGAVTVLADCYNSNPESLRSVLDFVTALPWKGRKVVVLGSMLELGALSDGAHRAAGELVAGSPLDLVFLFGQEMGLAAQSCAAAGVECRWTADFDILLQELSDRIRPGDLILIKGSRGMAMERLLDPLKAAA